MRVSYLEIYNEDVRDLLAKAPRALEIKENPDGGVRVQDLSHFAVKSAADIANVLRVRTLETAAPSSSSAAVCVIVTHWVLYTAIALCGM